MGLKLDKEIFHCRGVGVGVFSKAFSCNLRHIGHRLNPSSPPHLGSAPFVCLIIMLFVLTLCSLSTNAT